MTRDEVLAQAKKTLGELSRPFDERATILCMAHARAHGERRTEIMRQIAALDHERHEALAPFVKQYADVLAMLPPPPVIVTADGKIVP